MSECYTEHLERQKKGEGKRRFANPSIAGLDIGLINYGAAVHLSTMLNMECYCLESPVIAPWAARMAGKDRGILMAEAFQKNAAKRPGFIIVAAQILLELSTDPRGKQKILKEVLAGLTKEGSPAANDLIRQLNLKYPAKLPTLKE